MTPEILKSAGITLIGMHLQSSLLNNRIGELWQNFGPMIKAIVNRLSVDRYSVAIYPANYFQNFNPANTFERWAAVEVGVGTSEIPGLEKLVIPAGLYAVFHYKGSSDDSSIFQYIYSDWLPKSAYQLDLRPHFEVLGEKYRNNDPNSEEAIWIPIKAK